MNKPSLSPALVVHWSLYALIVLLVAGIGYGTYYIHQRLSDYVVKVDHLKIDSDINQQSIENAQKLRLALDKNKDSVTRAAAIVADTQYYEYQDQIVKDVTSYASASGLTVLGFDFSAASSSKTSSIKGVKTMVATISLQNPVSYMNYLKFLKLIERNLTKMQVTQIDISNDLKTTGAISSPVITLEVYVR
jgi:hypothetical protein